MKIGDYVRVNIETYNKFVGITKLENETNDYWFFEDLTIPKRTNKRSKEFTNINELIIKSSPNIIDLITIGDLMYIDINPDDCGGIVVPRIAETERELKHFTRYIESGSYILKGIVTKEQLNNMTYWVDE